MDGLRILVMLAGSLLFHRYSTTAYTGYTSISWMNSAGYEDHIKRLAQLMEGMVARADSRFKELAYIKTNIDEKSLDERRAFEMGYIMGDIIELYRKTVVYTHKQLVKEKNRYQEQDRLRFMEYAQAAYIRVFHLVHMMHEINPKLGADNTGQITKMNLNELLQANSPTFYSMPGFSYSKILNDIRAERHKERQEKILKEKRARMVELEMEGTVKPGTIKKTTNWWPVAYGWDIDYYW